ncbi:PKD domain-containing protein [candidate division KSB1 bacterium]|nr:PKD domain-containing protein [candidate division KSB1 bacterium]
MKRKRCILIVIFFIASISMARDNIQLVNYGPSQSVREGDDDFIQLIFFRVDGKFSDSLYLRIFDIDCGGDVDLNFGGWNTETRFSFYGGTGAFSSPSLKNAKPDEADIRAGRALADAVFGEDAALNNSWHTLVKLAPADGERIGDAYYFKLVVQGVSGNDANAFDVRLSSSPAMNVTPAEIEMFSYSPTLRLRKDENIASITFKVAKNVKHVTVHNFDLAGAQVQLLTAFRSNLPIIPSGQGEWVKSVIDLEPIETGRECAIALGQGAESPNDVSLFVTDDQEVVLPIRLPVYLKKLNQRPEIQKSLIALSDCQSIVFDAKATTDRDGDLLEFYWEFGDGETATGSRIVHRYNEQKTYEALLIVSDNSGEVGNSSFERFKVKVNQPPVAQAGKDVVTAPRKPITFDGSASTDPDGLITLFYWEFGDGRTGSGPEVRHSYLNPGTYRAVLRVEDDSDSPCNFTADEITVWVNAAPTAVAGEDMRGSVGQMIRFNGEKSSDSDGEIVAYDWAYGDDAKGSGKFSQHRYASPGKYLVRLTVTDNADVDNSRQSDELEVFINAPPVAIAGKDTKGAIDEPLTFDGSASYDSDGSIILYSWDFGDGSRKEGVQVTHAYKSSGNYIVSLTVQDDSGTDSDKSSADLKVFVNQSPVANAGPDQLLTVSEVTFSAAASTDTDGDITKYEWDFGDGTTGTGPTPIHFYNKPGRYQVELTVTDNSGTKNNRASDVMTVVINEKPIADAGPDQRAAIDQIFTFDGGGSQDADGEIAEYIWEFGDGRSASGKIVSHRYEHSGTYAVGLTVKDNTGQVQAADFDEAIVIVNAQPVALCGPDVLTVPAESVLFDGSGSFDPDQDALTYRWEFSDGEHPATTEQTRRSFTAPGIYTAILTVSDNSNTTNSTARDTVFIKVNNAPIAHAGKDIHSCDKPIIFDGSASVDPDGDPLTFTWDFGDGSKHSQGVHVLHHYQQGGTYPVILTVDDGLGLKNSRHSASITVTINEPPYADAGENETFCSGEIIILNAGNSKDPENSLLKYQWDFGDGTTAEGLNPTKIYKKDGIYQVRLTVQDDSGLPCNTSVVTKTIQIIESPVAIAGPDQEVCTNTPVFFDGSASRDYDGVVNSYFWDFGDGTTGGGATPNHSYKKAGIYRVVLTITGDLRGDCDNSNTDELLVTVHDAPLAQFSGESVAAVNQTVTLDGSASVSEDAEIVDYLWDFGDGATDSGKIVTHSYQQYGIYLIKLTIRTSAATICNSSTTSKLITINQQPVAEAGADQMVGIDQLVFLDGSASKDVDGAVVSYLWDFGSSVTKSGMLLRHRFAQAGRHAVALRVTDNSSAENNVDNDTVWVTVSSPVQPVITVSAALTCPRETVRFSAMESQNTNDKKVTCRWYFGDGKTEEGMEVGHSFAKSGVYDVVLMMDDRLMLDNSITSATKMITVNHPPVAVAGGDRLICPGQELVFDAGRSYDLDGDDWQAEWDFGDGIKSTTRVAKHIYKKSGRYVATLRVTDRSGSACSMGEDRVQVIVNTPPLAVAGEDRQVFSGGAHDAVLFDATASTDADGDGLVYEWDFGDGRQSRGARVYHAYDQPGIYHVKLTVDDGKKTACSKSQDEVTITVVNRK